MIVWLTVASIIVSGTSADAKNPINSLQSRSSIGTSTTEQATIIDKLGFSYNDSEIDLTEHKAPSATSPHRARSSIGDTFEFGFYKRYQLLKDQLTGALLDESGQDSSGQVKESGTDQRGATLSPVILVPGYGGSRLEAKRNKTTVKHYFCEKHSDWSNIWIDLKLMLPYMIDCLIDDFRLEFDTKTNRTHNTQGIDIRVREPDNLATVEYLTDIHLSSFSYFAPIIRKLTYTYGYKRDYNILGAPYDFRKAPNELEEYFDKMRRTSESLYEQFGGKRINFICHSMGCNNVLYFLQNQSQQWKDKHVLRLISLAAPWGGAMQAVRATAFGDNLGLPYLFSEAELKIVQQSVPSTMYLFPNERVFKNVPLIRTHVDGFQSMGADEKGREGDRQERNTKRDAAAEEGEVYKANNFKRFFEKINHPDGYLMWLNTKGLLRSLEAPGVEVWCIYGTGHATLGRMEFHGDFPNSKEEDFHDDGDGTVTIQSASICQQWSSEQKYPIKLKTFFVNHVDILKDNDVIDTIDRIIKEKDA